MGGSKDARSTVDMVKPKWQRCREGSGSSNEARSGNDGEKPALDAPQMEDVKSMQLKFLNSSADAMIE